MGLLDRLRDLGAQLKILEVAPPQDAAPIAKRTTRTITLADLAAEVRADEVRALAELPAELSVSFERVYEAAGVKPAAHGWTIGKLTGLLQTDQYKTMDRAAAQKAILGLLAAEKATVEEIVKDAVARDQALDAYEEFVRKKMKDRKGAMERKIADLKSRIRQLEEQCSRLAEEGKADEEQWRRWHDRKIAGEKEMARAIGCLLDDPVVSVDRDHPM